MCACHNTTLCIDNILVLVASNPLFIVLVSLLIKEGKLVRCEHYYSLVGWAFVWKFLATRKRTLYKSKYYYSSKECVDVSRPSSVLTNISIRHDLIDCFNRSRSLRQLQDFENVNKMPISFSSHTCSLRMCLFITHLSLQPRKSHLYTCYSYVLSMNALNTKELYWKLLKMMWWIVGHIFPNISSLML